MAMFGGLDSALKKKGFADSERDVSEFVCPVCLEVFDRPVTTQCGHTFCQSCLQECLRPQKPVCAVCRATLGKWAKATELEILIHNTVSTCKGCRAEMCLSLMRSHTAACFKYQEYIDEGVKTTARSQPPSSARCQTASPFPALTATSRTWTRMGWLSIAHPCTPEMLAKWCVQSVPQCHGETRTTGAQISSST
uniref:RING-type E3 ubiquitin transferase n=1 Tax=Anguilla anguilla TaxID=7936 RepID=A0A0E9WV67_ANGAN